MEDYKKKLGNLADKLKNETPKTPIQKVSPVKEVMPVSAEEDEARFNNWIPKRLKKEIKSYGVLHDISQKDIAITALKDFLRSKGIKVD